MEAVLADLHWGPILATIIYSALGFVVLFVAYLAFDKLMPYSFHKEIEEDQNVALGIIIGSLFIALAIIISAAIKS
ncbi:MAG: putative membrane protein [Gammaproteobacteria bacterium]|jgi:putative membrane protein